MYRNRFLAAALAVLFALASVPHAQGATDTRSYAYQWTEDKLTTVEFWNDPSRVALEYAANPWPQGQFAAERAMVNAARIVLRDGLQVTNLINSLGRQGTARVHGAEANGPNNHHDYPPHVHIFYLYVSSGNWNEINSHAYLNAQGKVTDNFVIPQICGGGASYSLPVDQWLDMKDETCTPIWQQRFTSGGDYEIRRNASGPTYALRAKSVSGNLASVDVLVNGTLRWNVTTTEYNGLTLRLVAKETDYQAGTVTTETWQGQADPLDTLVSHTTNTVPLTATPPPAPTTPAPTATTPAPTATTPAPTATTPAPTQTTPRTITESVVDYDDDAFQDGTALTSDLTTVWVGDHRDFNNSYAAFRFGSVDVPRGVTIQSASLRLYSIAADSTAMKVNVYGHDTGNSGKFSASNLPGGRTFTSAFTNYANPAPWAGNTWYSIDVTSIVSEISARSDWASGNALTLIAKGVYGMSGMRRGVRGVTSWDNANAPQLVVTYSSSAPPPPPPTATTPAPTATTPAPTATTPAPPPTTPPPTGTAPPSNGTTYYVATNGNDSNPGTETRPWRTVQKAANTLTAGQKVYIKAGTYNERVLPARSGTAGNFITYAAYPGQAVTINGSGISINNSQGIFDMTRRSYIRVSGLTITNCAGVCIFAEGASNLVIDNNNTVNSGSSGIGIWSSSNVTVDGNDVAVSGTNGANEAISFGSVGNFEIMYNHVHNDGLPSGVVGKEGIDVKQGAHDGKVHHNTIDHMNKISIYVDAYDAHTYNIDIFDNIVHDTRMGITLASELGGLLENIKVYNNVIWNIYYMGIRTFGQVEATNHPMQNIYYLNNTVYNASEGINVANTQITNFVVRNNIVTNNTRPLVFSDPSLVTVDHNLTSGNPLYVNPAGGNFRVQTGSPAVNAGSSTNAPSTDMDGVARPASGGFDIGAYER